MAVSQIEEKILGRLARQVEHVNPLLSAAFYQTLGLSILLSRKLFRARKVRRLDITRDTKSLKLYHHIIWLAREGLSITEIYILPECQTGKYGFECQVMAAKLRASLYHVFCLFHNHPPINNMGTASPHSTSPSSPSRSKHANSSKAPSRQATGEKKDIQSIDNNNAQKKPSKLRDPIPSMTSETSYVTNPFVTLSQTPPPPNRPVPQLPYDNSRRTPSRPPGINIPSPSSAGTFLLPPLNFVPMTKDYFQATQELANTFLTPTNALRLSVSLEHAAFAWECEKNQERAKKLARRTIKEVYASTDGLDDDEFADAAALVQFLAGLVRRGGSGDPENSPQSKSSRSATGSGERKDAAREPLRVDRTISVSPTEHRSRRPDLTATLPRESISHTPERLSTVPEVESTASDPAAPERSANTSVPPTSTALTSPSISRRSSGVRPSSSSAASDKASKRRLVEQAEEAYHRRGSSASRVSTRSPRNVHGRTEAKPSLPQASTSPHGETRSARATRTPRSSNDNGRATKPNAALRPPRSPVIPSMKPRPAPDTTSSRVRQTSSPVHATRVRGQTEGYVIRHQSSPSSSTPAPRGGGATRESSRSGSRGSNYGGGGGGGGAFVKPGSASPSSTATAIAATAVAIAITSPSPTTSRASRTAK